jgi:hypothetical protein
MPWSNILLALIRCELKARYDCLGNWQVSAKGALPVVLFVVAALVIWDHASG